MNINEKLKEELNKCKNYTKAKKQQVFYKTFKGGYGEGDVFIGASVPEQRKVAKQFYKEMSIEDAEKLLREKIHEHRLTALFIFTLKYQKTKDEKVKEEIVNIYLKNTQYVNNWDLVDSSAHKILGEHLKNKERDILYKLAKSENLWEQRISIIATMTFIKEQDFKDTLAIAEMLLNHKHDLIHKAVGWMLREIGKKDFKKEYEFLKQHYINMPRTMLRYSIEKFDEDLRQDFLKGRIV